VWAGKLLGSAQGEPSDQHRLAGPALREVRVLNLRVFQQAWRHPEGSRNASIILDLPIETHHGYLTFQEGKER